jgi:hypothetical protein
MKNLSLLRAYLLTVFIIALFGILDSIFALTGKYFIIFVNLASTVFLLWFVFSVIALAIFMYQRLNAETFVLPLYYIITTIALITLSVLISTGQVSQNITTIISIVGILGIMFEVGFSIYLIKKYKLINLTRPFKVKV